MKQSVSDKAEGLSELILWFSYFILDKESWTTRKWKIPGTTSVDWCNAISAFQQSEMSSK